MFEGSIVALVTPMRPSGDLDTGALHRLVRWHVAQGTQAVVAAGTTGESATLTADEHHDVLRVVIDAANGDLPVIAGCGSNSTQEALLLHRMAFDAGASAALHVTGYYNKPSQQGIVEHFKALSACNDLPIIVYNVPPRASVDIAPETMARLAYLPTVCGVKDATRDLSRPALERLQITGPFDFLTGEDATAVAYNAAGGVGCISVTANVAPRRCADIQRACQQGDFVRARRLQLQLMPLHQALFVDPSPTGVKYACSALGLCDATVRLPLVPASRQARDAIDSALQTLNLL